MAADVAAAFEAAEEDKDVFHRVCFADLPGLAVPRRLGNRDLDGFSCYKARLSAETGPCRYCDTIPASACADASTEGQRNLARNFVLKSKVAIKYADFDRVYSATLTMEPDAHGFGAKSAVGGIVGNRVAVMSFDFRSRRSGGGDGVGLHKISDGWPGDRTPAL